MTSSMGGMGRRNWVPLIPVIPSSPVIRAGGPGSFRVRAFSLIGRLAATLTVPRHIKTKARWPDASTLCPLKSLVYYCASKDSDFSLVGAASP